MGEGLDDIDTLDDLVAAIAAHDRRHAQIAIAANRLLDSGDWSIDGALSFRAWLRQHARMSQRAITALLKYGTFLGRFDHIGRAAVSGRLPASHVAAMHDVALVHRRGRLDQDQEWIVDAIAPLDHDQLDQFCQQWAERVDAEHDGPEPKEPDRSFSLSRLPDGSGFGNFTLTPTGANELEQALQTARQWNGPGDDRSVKLRNADAFEDIIRFFNANHDRTGSKRHHPHVALHIDAAALSDVAGPHATTPTGQVIASSATAAYLCDCVIHRVVHAGSIRIDYGREVRSVPRHLFHAVADRDRGCRFPGCHRPPAWCDAHHIAHWTPHAGETAYHNLVLLCDRHHHLVHQHHWQIVLFATGDVAFTTPDGRTLFTRPHHHTTTPVTAAHAPPDTQAA